jgi:hypothetical protein
MHFLPKLWGSLAILHCFGPWSSAKSSFSIAHAAAHVRASVPHHCPIHSIAQSACDWYFSLPPSARHTDAVGEIVLLVGTSDTKAQRWGICLTEQAESAPEQNLPIGEFTDGYSGSITSGQFSISCTK